MTTRAIERTWPDWFTGQYAQDAFERHLLPIAGRENFYALQIGAYCGDATEWLLTNVVTGKGSWLVDVDTWEGSKEAEHEAINFREVERFYLQRMEPFIHLGRFKGTSDDYFAQHPVGFDFIYIDGAHNAEQVLRDAVNADRYLNIGGLIAFDDYRWWEYGNNRDTPGPAIDSFLRCYEKRYETLEKDGQVWVRKVR